MILQRILEQKRVDVEDAKRRRSLDDVKAQAQEAVKADKSERRFRAAIQGKGRVALIAEVKKASPSKGVIQPNFDPARLARAYAAGGASAISVLTDETFFQGSLDHLRIVRESVALPVLRKEFIIDPYQLYEAKANGADAALLIVAALEPALLKDLRQLAEALELDALVETHSEEEVEIALESGADIIGINNRDLRTFHTTLAVTERLAPLVPKDVCLVSESGINSRDDIESLAAMGVDAVLVGEALARDDDPAEKTRSLLGVAVGDVR